MSDRAFVDGLNRTYFDGALAPAFLARLSALPVHRDDARTFVERMFRLMRQTGYPAQDVSVLQGEVLGTLLARLLPGTWGGRVPPITVAGRHRQIDQLVAKLYPTPGRLIDVACGFPPLTTLDTASALPGWEIMGVDRSLPAYLVHDGLGNYAVFDQQGQAQYFQPVTPTPEAWNALLADWDATRGRFEALLQALLARAAAGAVTPSSAEGATLSVDPARAYEQPRLRFVRSDLAALSTAPADVVRCFNMLLYFDDAFRTEALGQFAVLLREGGLLVTGTDWVSTTECRYFTYRKSGGRLVPREFTFSLDNLAPLAILPWYTLHDDDREVNLLAELSGLLRADEAFARRFRARSDELRAEYGLCPRKADGYYGEIASSVSPADLWVRWAELSPRLDQELGAQAVEVLGRKGRPARVNEIGHVAVSLAQA